jgi:RNA polymerase sigma factor (TIGR02999 family)
MMSCVESRAVALPASAVITHYNPPRWSMRRIRAHFFAMAAQMMRQILVDHARRQSAAKRGGNAVAVEIDESSAISKQPTLDLLALDDAMKRLAALDSRQCQIVELRFFGGLSIEETAEVMKISPATTKREWTTARLWLHNAMSNGVKP